MDFTISIHAPTRGATLRLNSFVFFCVDFNPRSHEGSDLWIMVSQSVVTIFQSTLPRGERRRPVRPAVSYSGHFNPRSHEGSDYPLQTFRHKATYFNPRSHEGSDDFHCVPKYRRCHISIHAPTRGATIPDFFANSINVFQSTLPRGERHKRGYNRRIIQYFNPRSHEGSDSNFRQKVLFSLSKNCLKYLILTTNYFN